MSSPLVSIAFINYNTKHFIKGCLDSVLDQTYPHKELIFIDNDSKDGSVEFVREHYKNTVRVVDNKDNLGYAKALNQGARLGKGKYIWIMNLDIRFESDYLAKAVAKMEEDQKIAALTGKLLKYDFEHHKKIKLIDSLGLFCYRNRRIIDYGQGLEDQGQFDIPKEVFGVSGAAPLYQKAALEKTAINGQFVDEDFFMYKEDIDISWRLRLAGFKCYYLPTAVAYHGRGTGVLKRFTHLEVLKGRRHLSRFQKYYAYKNQRLMQVKNELWGNFLHDFFPILFKEILIFGYILFREPYLLSAVLMFFRQLPGALKKRRQIMKRRVVGWREMRRWLEGKNEEFEVD